ncbi:hypothetical protein AB1Y20_019762 [Prymnesium parvum]|uniref:DNA (cytosine-5-)-methyltransferase n=1 Tax=Prymnesium parvum TaxID=97485 RepID=A0AB34JRY8_PRYPA
MLDETEPTIRVRYFATNDSHRLPADALAAWHSRKPADPEQLQIKSKSLKQHYRRAVQAAEEKNKAQSSGDPVEEVWSDDMEADDEGEEAVDEEGHDVEGKEDVPSSAKKFGNIGSTQSATGVGPEKARRLLVARAPMEQDPANLTTPQLLPGKSSRRKSPTKDELIQQYARGSMVWAKIHGFPWWPSQVRANRQIHDAEPRVRVRFWFTNDDATLPMDKLALWSEREPEDPTKMKIKSKSVIKQYGQALTLALAALEAGAVEEEWSDDQEEAEEEDEPGSADAELELLRSRSPKRPSGARPLYTCGSLVWAKIYGFPWWPSQVCSIRELYHSQPRVGVRFCYTGEEQTLLLEQLMPWASREPQDPTRMRISSNVMRTRYRKALEAARGMATKDMFAEEDEGKWSDGDDLAEQHLSDKLQDAEVGGVVESMHHSGWLAQRDDAGVTPAPTKRKRRTKPLSIEPFARGSMVWAKIYGFPWWPSQVRSNKQIHDAEPRVRVRFWFTNDDATLPMDKLALWSEREPEDPTKMKIKSKSVIKQYGQALTLALAALEAGAVEEEWSDDQEEAEDEDEPGSADAELELLRSRSPKRPSGARPLYARGSLVWAKIYGFPWWPSQVCSIRELYHSQPRVGVRFCYTGEEQTLLLEQLMPWASREPQAVKAMSVKPKVKKDYARALEEARGIATDVAENDDREGSWSDHSEVVHAAQSVAHQLMDVEPNKNRGDVLHESLHRNRSHKECIHDNQHFASLKRGDLAWVKLSTYPWWPSQVLRACHAADGEPELHVVLLFTNDQLSLRLMDDNGTPTVVPWNARKMEDNELDGVKSRAVKQQYRGALDVAMGKVEALAAGKSITEEWSGDEEVDKEPDNKPGHSGQHAQCGDAGVTPAPTKRQKRTSATPFSRGSMVWAKIHGFPWWPSQVRSTKKIHDAEPRVRVRFWFTNDDATLPMDKLALWSEREPEDPTKMKIKSKSVIKQYGQALTLALAALEAGAVEEEWSDDQEEAEEEDEPGSADAELELLRSRSPKRPSGARPLYARGSLVWAKIYGFPWWPSQVCSIRELYHSQPRVGVRFCYTGEEQTLLLEQLMPWASREPQVVKAMSVKPKVKKDYARALEEARGIAAAADDDLHLCDDELPWADDLVGVEDEVGCNFVQPFFDNDGDVNDNDGDVNDESARDVMHSQGIQAICRDSRALAAHNTSFGVSRDADDRNHVVTPMPTKRKKRKSSPKDELTLQYARGTLVWAKIYGFPWWPSQVRANRQIHDAEPRVRVRFWFTNDDATLPMDKLALWSEREPEDPTKMKIKSKSVIKQYGQALTLALAALEAGAVEEEWSDDQEEAEEEDEPGSADAELELLRSRSPKRPSGARPLYACGSLVWAKIYGFPWWPSQVCSIRELYHSQPRVGVRFCYTGEEQTVLLEQLMPWASREPQDPTRMRISSNVMRTRYRKALAEAQKIFATAKFDENDDGAAERACEKTTRHREKKGASRAPCLDSSSPYARGSLVWAKIYGFPWWPSQVRSTRALNDEVPALRIRMLHTNDNLTLPLNQLKLWYDYEGRDPESIGSKKKKVRVDYRCALELAMKMASTAVHGNTAEEVWSDDMDESVNADDDTDCDEPDSTEQESNVTRKAQACADARRAPCKTHKGTVEAQTTDHGPFSRGSLVWTKIHGFPWWPSRVFSAESLNDAEPSLQVVLLYTEEHVQLNLTCPKGKAIFVPWDARAPEDPNSVKRQSVRTQYANAIQIARAMAAASADEGGAEDFGSDSEQNDEDDVSAAPRRRGWKRGRTSGNPNKAHTRAEQHAPLRPKAKRKDSGREGWVGPCESVGAEGERFYEAIRIAGEVFHVGDDVVVKASEGHVNELWTCKIEGFWESRDGERLMDCRWYYTPEETRTGRLPGHDRREIFESVVTEENPVGVISAPCRVLSWSAYQRWLEEEIADDDEDDEHVFVCRAKYQPGTGEFLPLTGNSCLAEVARIGTFHKRIEDKRPQGESHTPGAEVARKQPELPAATISQVQARRSRLGRFAEAAARLLPSAAPERMPCRERERAEVINALRAALLEGTLGSSLYLSGTPGTGKTATVHQALRELAADDSLPSFRTIEVNAMKLSSAYQVYSLLWQALTGQAVTPQKALGSLERCFSTSPGKRKRQTEKLIMVLDEIDYLVTRKQSVIYNMFDWATSAGSSLIIVGISNTMDLPERLLPRVHSRLGIRRINFLPYSYEDIITIIQDRLGGLIAFHADGLELCCRKVASVTGDVRRALEICRQAAQIAEREEADIVDAGGTPEPNSVVSFGHISAAVKQLKGSVAQRALQCAPMHHQLILACFILLQASTGRSEVLAEVLLQRHSDLCRTLGSNKVSQPTDAEQRECISRLCSSKILAVTETYGSIRLVVQPEDVRVMAREHPLVSQLFTH